MIKVAQCPTGNIIVGGSWPCVGHVIEGMGRDGGCGDPGGVDYIRECLGGSA